MVASDVASQPERPRISLSLMFSSCQRGFSSGCPVSSHISEDMQLRLNDFSKLPTVSVNGCLLVCVGPAMIWIRGLKWMDGSQFYNQCSLVFGMLDHVGALHPVCYVNLC